MVSRGLASGGIEPQNGSRGQSSRSMEAADCIPSSMGYIKKDGCLFGREDTIPT